MWDACIWGGSLLKGDVHPDIKLVSVEAEKWEKQLSESFSENQLKIGNLWIFEGAFDQTQTDNSVSILQAPLPLALY